MPEKKKPGAPRGNTNAMSHGLNANLRHGLKAGKLPKDCRYIENQLYGLRRKLEAAVVAAKGDVSLPDAACIQTAIKWERHGALALRWLRLEEANLKPTERLAFSREIARASTERDRALQALGLDRDAKDNIIDALYARAISASTNGADHE